MTPEEFARHLAREDAEIREGMRATIATTLDPELSAFDKGAQVALRALAESFENNGMDAAAHATRRALAVVTSHAHRACIERCSAECPAPVFDDEEFYDGHLDYDGDDQ